MNHKRPPLPAIIVVVLLVIVGAYFIVTRAFGDGNGALAASGTIEATEVNVSPETSGKVKDVLVGEGQAVKKGDPILTLDETLLKAQRQVAQSGVDSAHSALLNAQNAAALAQAQYDATLTAARAQEGAQRLADWSKQMPNWFEQPNWYFSRPEQITAAQSGVDQAQQALNQAQANLEQVIQDLNNASFVQAETRLSEARANYLIAKAVHDHAQVTGGKVSPEAVNVDLPAFAPAYRIKIGIAKKMSGKSDILDVAQDDLDAATTELHDAEQAYSDLLGSQAAERVQQARAELSVAQERYEVSLDTLHRLQVGAYSPQVQMASIGLEQAQGGLQQAQDAVKQAQANLALLDTQMSKLTIYAPMEGVILTRNVEPGEFVQPGASAITMANINDLSITVYVPEDRYGEISLGQQATVSVDSFPNETFEATVSFISDQAEFTPRNVQTVEGRSSTVYAVKLKVSDPEGKLKIGMPGDVTFSPLDAR
jgi:membrane fusion protein YbhG